MRGTIGRAIRTRVAPTVICALALGSVAADELRGYLEFVGTQITTTRREDDGPTVETESTAFFQRFNLYIDKHFYPNLRLRAGGFFERLDSDLSPGQEQKTTSLRPYINFTLRTPVNWAEIGYNLDQQSRDPSAAPSTTDVRETWSASLAYYPDPRSRFRGLFTRTNLHDRAREVRDSSEDRFLLTADSRPLKPLQLDYRGTWADRTDRLNETDVLRSTQTGRARYTDNYWQQRVRLATDYRVTFQSTETTSSGTGEVHFPLFPFAGLSAVDNEVERIVLDPNPALIDGNRVISSGVDLGIPFGGIDDDLRQMGLDLASEQELNNLLVWVDRELLPQTVAQFSWDVYISSDNEEWVLHARIPLAEFGPFVTRFEVRFPAVVTRYVKVVTAPVSPSDPAVTDPSILVTELEAERVADAADVERKISDTSQLFNLSLRTRILSTPGLYYELTYFLSKTDSDPGTYRLQNGLSLNHRFNQVYSINSRVALQRDRVSGSDREALLYSVALSAVSIETLRHRLVFNGRNEEATLQSRKVMSVFLFNTMQLYRGVDLSLTFGKASSSRDTGETTETDEINLNTTLVPHRTMTFNLLYRDRKEESRGGELPGTINRISRSGIANIAYNPLATLYFFASYRLERRTDIPRRSFLSYSVDWTPFRDGTLQLSFRFLETVRSEDDSESTIISPRLRWNIGRGSFLDVAYEKTTNRFPPRESDTETWFAVLRLAF